MTTSGARSLDETQPHPAAGFYRTCVIDGVLAHSPADYVRRPPVPGRVPTLGSTHLHREALLTAAQTRAASGARRATYIGR
jgi:hypothetical protein